MNEYREKFQDLQQRNTFRGQTWFSERKDLVEQYSWAVPTQEAITYIAEFDDRIWNIGAGSGYWSHLIEDAGGNIFSIDKQPPEETWSDVKQATVMDVRSRLHDSVVLMVWPPYEKKMSDYVITEGPAHILYVGEPKGGCTGTISFFTVLEKEYGLVAKIELPSYYGVHDDFYHYVRKV